MIFEGFFRKGNNRGAVAQFDPDSNLFVVQGQLPYAELTRRGNGYQAMTTAAVAALVVRPTTTALFTLWNGEPDGGNTYVIDAFLAQQLVSGAAASRWGVWACVHPTGMAAVTDDITAKNSLSGKSNYGGKARCDVAATVVDDGWFPWGRGGDVEATGVLGGAQDEVPVQGRILVPPSAGVSLHVVASSVNEDFNVGFRWYEEQLELS